jgi:hypothetical protein
LVVAGRIGGWIALAQRYRATELFTGKSWHFQHIQLTWSMNYSGITTVGANSAGLYLSLFFPFRIGHSPLFIPWNEMKMEMKQSIFSGKYMEIHFTEVPGTLIRISEKLARKIAAEVGPELASKVEEQQN